MLLVWCLKYVHETQSPQPWTTILYYDHFFHVTLKLPGNLAGMFVRTDRAYTLTQSGHGVSYTIMDSHIIYTEVIQRGFGSVVRYGNVACAQYVS